MKKLWAPWRNRYLKHLKQMSVRCIFCSKPKEKNDRKNYILKRGEYCYTILNLYPYNNGHVMVVPYRHTNDLSLLGKEEIWETMQFVCEIQQKLRKKIKPAGFNIGINIGKDAGAGFDHLHMHIVPRWNGDTNFMPVLADTKIISESLEEVYQLLIK